MLFRANKVKRRKYIKKYNVVKNRFSQTLKKNCDSRKQALAERERK